MKKLITSVLLAFVFSITVYSQERIYFDENWEKTTQSKMEFYRETEAKGKYTLIKDFYKNGTLQMEGLASDTTPNNEVFEGKVTWYTPEGRVQSFSTFKNGIQAGPAQSFDHKGRLLEDIIYGPNDSIKGKSLTYKDVENESYYNTITEYESSEVYKTIVYDEDIKGIRYETMIDKNGNSETRYYGDKGKYIGSNTLTSIDSNEGLIVNYYSDPMRVSSIEKFKKDSGTQEITIFGKDGKILQEEKKNEKGGYKTTYDASGKKIGNLIYKYDKEADYPRPYEGDDYQYNYDYSYISAIDSYQNGLMLSSKTFSENGKLFTQKTYKDDILQEIKYYHQDGSLKSHLTYRDETPYNGTLYEDDTEKEYKEGILQHTKTFSEGAKLKWEKKLNPKKDIYESTVYNNDGVILYTYTQSVTDNDYFTAQIVQYVNGKPGNKSVVKDEILQSGKISFKSYSGINEVERNGKWISLKIYDTDGRLVQESKTLADTGKEEQLDYSRQTAITEDNLLYDF